MSRSVSSVKASLILLLASLIWGFAFVAQRLGMDHIGPFLFNGLRNLLGAVTVWIVIALRERRLAPLLADPKWTPTLICESRGTQAEDACVMRDMVLVHRFPV
jgi:drug/metabolite transporter (DMT)-like permease